MRLLLCLAAASSLVSQPAAASSLVGQPAAASSLVRPASLLPLLATTVSAYWRRPLAPRPAWREWGPPRERLSVYGAQEVRYREQLKLSYISSG